jgi:hypothetical protein
MHKQILMLTASGFILICPAVAANAQQTAPGAAAQQQTPAVQQQSAGQQQSDQQRQHQRAQAQREGNDDDDWNQNGGWGGRPWWGYRDWDHGGMMGREGTRYGRAGSPGMIRPGMMGNGMMMRMMFAMMDSDGDGTVSLQEFQAAHERIFKAMDSNKDGRLTLEEIQTFMRARSAPRQ